MFVLKGFARHNDRDFAVEIRLLQMSCGVAQSIQLEASVSSGCLLLGDNARLVFALSGNTDSERTRAPFHRAHPGARVPVRDGNVVNLSKGTFWTVLGTIFTSG